jgi:hypothetical protein
LAERQPDGRTRIVPSSSDIEAAAALVHLSANERIVYWFESPTGQINVGVSELRSLRAGVQYREVELMRTSAQGLSVLSETEALCIS